MPTSFSSPVSSQLNTAWTRLESLQDGKSRLNMLELFEQDAQRAESMTVEAAGLFLDYSKNLLDEETLEALLELAESSQLHSAIQAMFQGAQFNNTEQRAVLHTALRSSSDEPLMVDGQDIRQEIKAALAQMESFVHKVQKGEWRGFDGQAITDVVSIGIGGSYLGPRVAVEALRPYWQGSLRCHFVSNVDGADIAVQLQSLDPATTLFVIQSKSFKTQETLANANSARDWYTGNGGDAAKIAQHFVAVSSNTSLATAFGIAKENIFPMWDWVGGRYSLWSAIGLPIALQVGMPAFREMLQGAEALDIHFREAPFAQNMPVLLGLIGIWYHNFLGAHSYAIIPYDQSLENLTAHLQQVDMESNGKCVTREGEPVSGQTGPIIWGGAGTNGQHAYHQLLHQGTRWTPVDFILPLKSHYPLGDHHDLLVSNCLAQSQALLRGKTLAQAQEELAGAEHDDSTLNPLAKHKVIPGNRPSNMLLMEKLTPATFGALIALYEQKVFVQGVIWQLNSFDQWGVELGKQLSDSLLPILKETDPAKFQTAARAVDPSTRQLLSKFRSAKT